MIVLARWLVGAHRFDIVGFLGQFLGGDLFAFIGVQGGQEGDGE